MGKKSIYEIYFEKEEFLDRKKLKKEEPIDVIIPLINTNILFEKNLYSYYREIPVNRLIIGDGGCTDDSLEIVKKFPRVKVIDQTNYRSQGFCIAELISLVETDWFIYLHSDVYLPENWYDIMKKYQDKYDWYECNRRMTTLIEFDSNIKNKERAYSGSQMGRKEAFKSIIPKIQDDYLQRNEDIIFHELIEAEGFKYGRIFDTFHYHQVMNKRGDKEPKFKKITFEKAMDKEWEIKIYTMQAKGIIKYLRPKLYLIKSVNDSLKILMEYNALNIKDFKIWVKKNNKIWIKYLEFRRPIIKLMFNFLIKILKIMYNKLLKKYV